jgi:hypothetical protein
MTEEYCSGSKRNRVCGIGLDSVGTVWDLMDTTQTQDTDGVVK